MTEPTPTTLFALHVHAEGVVTDSEGNVLSTTTTNEETSP